MKKYPKYQLRVGDELLLALQKAGSAAVRSVLERAFLTPETPRQPVVPAWAQKLQAHQQAAQERLSPEPRPEVPAAAPNASEGVSVVERSRQARLEAARASQDAVLKKMVVKPAAVPAMRSYPQMPPKVDYYALGDPEYEE